MEEWRRLGGMASRDLGNVVANTYGLLCTVASARAKLQPWAAVSITDELTRRRRDIDDNPVALLGRKHPSLPSADLDRAVDELGHLGARHARAGYTFLLYSQGVVRGGSGNDALRQAWNLLHATLRLSGASALKRVRAAAAQTRAFEDAVRCARSFPPMSPGRTGWMAAAERLAICAIISCTMALQILRVMHDAVDRELEHILGVLLGSQRGWRPHQLTL